MHADPHLDEQQLLQRATTGDNAAWVVLVRLHQEPVFRLAWLILADADEAEDVAQETFVHAWKAIERFDMTRPLRPWLLQIARNQASNRRRSTRRAWKALQRLIQNERVSTAQPEIPRQFAGAVGNGDMAASSVDTDALWRSVRRLGADDQEIIYLRIFLDLTIEESAQSLSIAPGTVKSRLNRALERLRAVAQHEFPELTQEQLPQGAAQSDTRVAGK